MGARYLGIDADTRPARLRLFSAEAEGLTDAKRGEVLLEVDVPWSDDVLRGDPECIYQYLADLTETAYALQQVAACGTASETREVA